MPYLSLLFWLKWKLMLRGYQRSKVALIGTIIVIVVFAPMSIGAAVGTAFGYHLLAPPYNVYLLRAVLLGIYGIWLMAPILGFALNESYDITRLFSYPISSLQIYIGSILSSFIDFPVLLALPLFVAALIGFSGSVPAAVCTFIALALFLFHTLALSQAIVLVSAGALRSRRWRDIMAVIGPLLALAWYLLFQVAPRYMVRADWHTLLDNPIWAWVNYCPAGFTAQAVGAAYQGAWWPAVGFLLLLAAVTGITVYLAGYLVQLVSVGEGISDPVRKHRSRLPASTTVSTPASGGNAGSQFDRWLPPVVAAVAGKEWKYLFRDPLFKSTLMSALYMFAVIVFAFVIPHSSSTGMHFGAGTLWIVTAMLLYGGSTLAFNIFGTDGNAAATLFLFPSARRQIILGKNLVMFFAMTAVNLALLLVLHLCLRTFLYLWQQYFLVLMATLVLIAAGNFISIRFPTRLVMRGWRAQPQSAGKGCGYGLVTMLGMLCCLLLTLPVTAAVIIPTYWVHPLWFALTLPLAAAYGIFIYLLSLHLTPPLLMQRETEIMATMLAEE